MINKYLQYKCNVNIHTCLHIIWIHAHMCGDNPPHIDIHSNELRAIHMQKRASLRLRVE